MFFVFFFPIDTVAIIPYASCVSNLGDLCLFVCMFVTGEMKNCDCIVNVHIAHRLPSRMKPSCCLCGAEGDNVEPKKVIHKIASHMKGQRLLQPTPRDECL